MCFVGRILTVITLLFYVIESQGSCSSYSSEGQCMMNTGGQCKWSSTERTCLCDSAVQMDVLVALDVSGSIGWSNFQIEKHFLKDLVDDINYLSDSVANIGFALFSTTVNFSRPIQSWDTTNLETYLNGIYWRAGWTNTPGVIETALSAFESTRTISQKIVVMITDGNPCMPESQGGCPLAICQHAAELKTKGIRVVVVAVGNHVNPLYFTCLLQSEDDFIPVADFTVGDFASIQGSLANILCPNLPQFKVTEVRAKNKGSTGATDGRYTRFVELYNNGREFNLNEVSSQGLIAMTANAMPDIAVPQGSYVVFYDGAEAPFPSIPSCHLCGSDCDISACTTTHCVCSNAIYVACGSNVDSTDCTNSLTLTGGATVATDACSACAFTDDVSASWGVTFTVSSIVIDEVNIGVDWIDTTGTYSYELMNKGFNNIYGANWAQSCTEFGTPGADPAIYAVDPAQSCPAPCTVGTCGGPAVCGASQCGCDASLGYYPQCITPTSCSKCLAVPPVSQCRVEWTKNGTDRFAKFSWSLAERDLDTRYVLNARNMVGDAVMIGLYTPIFVTPDYDRQNLLYGGSVKAALDICVMENDVLICDTYYSAETNCVVVTQQPTGAPTAAPIDPPTSDPTASPITATPTTSPVTATPTASPDTVAPTASPVTATPTNSPIYPTASPVLLTSAPATSAPTALDPLSSNTQSVTSVNRTRIAFVLLVAIWNMW